MDNTKENTNVTDTEEVNVSNNENSESGDYQEYVTFVVQDKDGNEVEMAVVDEFEFEKKNYVVGAIIEDDTINEEGLYIYKTVVKGEDFTVEKITNPKDYEKIAQAYMDMEAAEEE